MKCNNPECNNEVDALHMCENGLCEECWDKELDKILAIGDKSNE